MNDTVIAMSDSFQKKIGLSSLLFRRTQFRLRGLQTLNSFGHATHMWHVTPALRTTTPSSYVLLSARGDQAMEMPRPKIKMVIRVSQQI